MGSLAQWCPGVPLEGFGFVSVSACASGYVSFGGA